MVAAHQKDRWQLLWQHLQPGHVQSTGHCTFSGQRQAPEENKRRYIHFDFGKPCAVRKFKKKKSALLVKMNNFAAPIAVLIHSPYKRKHSSKRGQNDTYMTMRLAVLECSFSSSLSLIWRLVWKTNVTSGRSNSNNFSKTNCMRTETSSVKKQLLVNQSKRNTC